jgi:hypothetical protein
MHDYLACAQIAVNSISTGFHKNNIAITFEGIVMHMHAKFKFEQAHIKIPYGQCVCVRVGVWVKRSVM